jgi:hypothetical protein
LQAILDAGIFGPASSIVSIRVKERLLGTGESVDPLVWVDFNATSYGARDTGQIYIHLWKIGTLRDLERQHVQLKEGMELRMYDDDEDGIVATGIAHYDQQGARWVAVAKTSDVKYISEVAGDPNHWASTVDWKALRK